MVSEWSNDILNGTYKKPFSFYVNGILNGMNGQNTIDEEAEELLISTVQNIIGPFRIPFSQVPFKYHWPLYPLGPFKYHSNNIQLFIYTYHQGTIEVPFQYHWPLYP